MRTTKKKNWGPALTRLTILVIFLFALSGCGEFEKALDELTTQEVDLSQNIYSGESLRNNVQITLAKDAPASALGPVAVNRKLTKDIFDGALAVDLGVEETSLTLSGRLVNNAAQPGRLYVFFAPNETPTNDEAVLIGSVVLQGKTELEFEDSAGFDQSELEVEDNIRAYFMANAYNEDYHVFLYTEGVGDESIVAERLRVHVSPTLSKPKLVPAALLTGYTNNVQEISTVSLGGTFTNEGVADAHLMWVVGPTGEDVSVEDNLILEAYLAPGETIRAEDAVLPGGLKTLKSYIQRMADGTNITGTIVMTSDDVLESDIDDFRVEITATVGL
ncbi:MAG: hypothetical protein H6684_02395 [Deltaproteobacteria bacterium]|nr:hypothetical protein [Deltaproteobacteria bacterium]MCB9478067.1 hypothetical protein [Deltaproteobacteria bacterium]MCB9487563.1 hypothetical protein [Deltaproteobacteria bacterium]